jgi:hypothetical protein
MANFEDLFSDPIAALGYGLLTSRDNPVGTGFAMLQQSGEAKRQRRKDDMEEKMYELKMKEAMAHDVSYQFNPKTGELVAIDKTAGTAQPFGYGGESPTTSAQPQTPDLLTALGIPSPSSAPPSSGGGMNPATNQKFQEQKIETIGDADKEALKKIDEEASQSQTRYNLYGQAEAGLEGLDTGITAPAKGFASRLPGVGDYFGGKQYADKIQRAESAIGPITKTFRVAGEGSSSDLDVAILQKSAPSISNEPSANKFIIAAGKAQAQRNVDYRDTVRSLVSNGYSLTQAQQAYKKYTEANPIFGGEEVSQGLNPSRTATFNEWIQSGMPDNTPKKGGTDGGGAPSNSQAQMVRKTINGKNYVKQDGQWYPE